MIDYPTGSIGYKLLTHNNSYDFDVAELVSERIDGVSSLSIVIPYYNALETINLTLKYLQETLIYAADKFNNFRWEILIIDDGSDIPISKVVDSLLAKNVTFIELKKKKGRHYVRNLGIKQAKNEILMFIDADILVGKHLIVDHLKIHKYLKDQKQSGITLGLFNFLTLNKEFLVKEEYFKDVNDFRKFCIYRESWIGCKEDLIYAGQKFEIMKQTKNLKKWPKSGYLGPWIISNMVLGGLFALNKYEAKTVGGCSEIFNFYGFEETSLVSRIIASFNSFVIPVLTSNSIHLGVEKPFLSRAEKDKLFQKSHNLYFNNFLKQDIYNIYE